MTYENLEERILETLPDRRRTRLVAIDGKGGAGKSSLARKIQENLDDVQVVEVDDFWLPKVARPLRHQVVSDPGSDYDWRRLRDQVIKPLSQDEQGRYQRYDWPTDALAEWQNVPSGGTVVVEGVFSTRLELAPFYDLKIWVETPSSVCLDRGVERDGEQHRDLWENEWMKAYQTYIDAWDPKNRADIVIAGTERSSSG